jgi:hypothetical protein
LAATSYPLGQADLKRAHHSGHHNKPMWRRSNRVRRVAGAQGKNRVLGRTQHADIVGFHNFSRSYDVMEPLSATEDINVISILEAVYVPEKGVAVTGNYGIAAITGNGGAEQMSGSK